MQISRELSNGLKISSLIATVLVVAIHYNNKQFINLENGITLNYYFQEVITNGIARTAVPYFAFASGLFYFLSFKVSNYFNILKKKIHTLVIPYLLASLFIFIVETGYQYFFKNNPLDMTVYSIVKDTFLAPLSIQFWFLRDLIFVVIFSPVLWFFLSLSKNVIIFLFLILWYLDLEFMPLLAERHIITIEILLFYSFGGWCALNFNNFEKFILEISVMQLLSTVCVFTLLLLLRVWIDPFYYDGYANNYLTVSLFLQKTMILFGLFILISISLRARSEILLYFSGFSFFVFLFHSYPLARVIVKVTDFFILDAYKFYLTFPLAIIISGGLAVLIGKYTPIFFKIITGGRGPTLQKSQF